MPLVLTLWLFRPGNRSPEEEKDLPKVSQQVYVRPWNKNSEAETRVSAAKCCLVSSVLSELPGPRCFGTSPDKDLLSLWLQHPRALRANLNLFISCVTVVDLAANTWPVGQLEGFRETRNLPCVGRFWSLPSRVSAFNASPLSPDFLKGNLSSLSLSLVE